MYKIKLLLTTLIVLILIGELHAQNSWGVGLVGGYDIPLSGLKNWYSSAALTGGKIIFNTSQNNELEIEYNYNVFLNSTMSERMFAAKSQIKYAFVDKDANNKPMFLTDANGNYIPYAEVDKQTYPNAKQTYADSLYSSSGSSRMTVHSITVNTIKYFDEINFLKSRLFITGGFGFYFYKNEVDSLLYGGQPIYRDKKVFMKPFEDSRVSLGFNIGGGIDFLVADNIAIDLRGKYNFIVGELRPIEAYKYKGKGFKKDAEDIGGLTKVFPIQYVTFSASVKYYFQ